MLSISPIGSSSGAVSYYSTMSSEGYYVGGDSSGAGRWLGGGAKKLGLRGAVSRGAFRNLLLGLSPDGKKELVRNACNPARRSAFDLTFSVPKSVSCVWSQADLAQRKLIERACESALAKVLEVFDRECGFTRRGHLGSKIEKADLIAALFRHDTARGLPGVVPDANLHWHIILINTAFREDGTTGAFCARRLFAKDMKMMLGAMFRAEFSAGLEKLGLTSYRPEKENGKGFVSWFELDAVPKEFVRATSKRRQEIERWMIKHKVSGAKMAEFAALSTRRAKEDFSRKELFSAWKELGKQHGFTSAHLTKRLSQKPKARDVQAEAEAATERALTRITDERSCFSKTLLMRYAAEEAQGRGVGISEVELGVKQILENSAEIVRLKDFRGESNYTTREMLALEHQMFDSAVRGQGDATHSVDSNTLAAVLRESDILGAEQREAVRHITRENSRVVCVNGLAGTGKTTLLGVARKVWERHGFEVVGTALAATAAKRLEEGSGISGTHIHQLLKELESGKRKLGASSILILDEAGMIGVRTMHQIFALTESVGAKTVLIGDYRQLQPIEAGGAFRGIAARIGCFQLQDIIRQREEWARQSVHDLATGKPLSALARYAERGLLRIASHRDEAMEMLVSDWSKSNRYDLKNTSILVGTNLERITLNRLCQNKRLLAGELSEESVSVNCDELRIGDRVLFTKNNKALLVRNGEMGFVTELIPESRTLRVKLDNGLSILVYTESYSDLALGYSNTTHRCQGQSVEQSFVLMGGPMTDREISYVQGSRAKGTTRFYTDIISGGEDIEALARQMERSRAKGLAHDFVTDF